MAAIPDGTLQSFRRRQIGRDAKLERTAIPDGTLQSFRLVVGMMFAPRIHALQSRTGRFSHFDC